MRTVNLLLILTVVITILSAPAIAKDAPSLPEELSQSLIGRPLFELSGIDKLYVGIAVNRQYVSVTSDIDVPQINGLDWKELERKVMNRLLESGIKVVGNIKTVITVGLSIAELSELRVDINVLRLDNSQQHVFRVQTSLARSVHLTIQPKLGFQADVWKANAVMQAASVQNMAAEVTKVTLAQVDEFIADYRLANPQGMSTADSNDIATVLPVVTPRQTTPVVKPTTAKNNYVASKNSKVFHKPDCRWAQRIKPSNLVTFRTREQAIQAGKRPCKQCQP